MRKDKYGDKKVVITTYGHGKKIEKIVVNTFDVSSMSDSSNSAVETTEKYCKSINSIEFNSNDSWVSARLITANIPYSLHNFFPFKFSDLILKLEDYAIQYIVGDKDQKTIVNAIKSESEEVKSKFFRNMSKTHRKY